MGLCREVCFKCLEKNQPVLTFNVFAFGIDWSNKFVSCPPQMIKTEFTDNPPKSRWLLSVVLRRRGVLFALNTVSLREQSLKTFDLLLL